MMTTVKHVLDQKGREVHAIAPDATVFDALQMMDAYNIGALVVLDGERLAGIMSERDYARQIVLKGKSSPNTQVRDIMSTEVVCARLNQTVEACMALMTARNVRHLPVLEHKRVVGLISIGDTVRTVIDDQKFIIEQLETYIHGHAH